MLYRYADGYHHRGASRISVSEPEPELGLGTYMVDGVHGHTASLGPRVALDSKLVLGTRRLCYLVSPISLHAHTQYVLNSGFSVRPPPATIPIMPRELLLMTFFAPDGSLMRVLPSSGLCPITVT